MDSETKSDRRKSLDQHSSSVQSNRVDEDFEKFENTSTSVAVTDRKAKPFGSLISSVFGKSSESSVSGASFSWLSSRSEKVVGENLNLENLHKITHPGEVILALKHSLELKSDDYFHVALNLVTHLCEQNPQKQIAVELGSLGACSLIDQILGLKIISSQSCECCLRSMCSLITQPFSDDSSQSGGCNTNAQSTATLIGISNNVKKLSSSGTIYRIIKAGYTHMTDTIVLEWALRVVNFISVEEGMLPKLLACGGCDLLIKSLATHPQCDEVLIWTCRNIHNFVAYDSAGNTQAKFGDSGVCETLVTVVLADDCVAISEQAAVWVLKATGSLARYHPVNKRKLGVAGVAGMINRLHGRFSLQNRTFSESICWAVGNLSYPDEDNQTLLGSDDLQSGGGNACEIVNRSLTQHLLSTIVVQESLRAVRNLVHQHDDNLNAMFGMGVVDTMVAVLRQYRETNSDVMQWVWYATASLAEHDGCLTEFGRNGVCSAVVASINRFSEQEDVVQWAALAVAKIAASPTLSVQLGDSLCCQALIQALQLHMGNADVAEEILSAVGALCSTGNHRIREIFSSKLNVCEQIVKALVMHERVDSVVEAGLFAVMHLVQRDAPRPLEAGVSARSSLATDDEDTSLLIGERSSASLDRLVGMLVTAQAYKVLPRVLARHGVDNEYISEYGCRALCDLATLSAPEEVDAPLVLPSTAVLQSGHREICLVNHDTLGKLGQFGAAAALCAVLQSHMLNVHVARHALLALDRMCFNERNIPLLRTAGACALVVRAVQTHYLHAEGIVTVAYSLIAHLCYDDQCRDRIGGEGGGEAVLMSLAHHLHSAAAAQLGCEALSALCLSPAQDAVASIIYKEISYNVTQTKASVAAAVDWISFDASNMDHLNILSHGTADNTAAEARNRSTTSSSNSNTKTTDSFFLGFGGMRGNSIGPSSGGFESLTDAATNLLTTAGMSDQESELIAARQQSMYTKREGNNERLTKSGVNAMLITLMQTHSTSADVLIAVCNAVNSLSMYPANRLAMGRDGLLDLLTDVHKRCLGFDRAVASSSETPMSPASSSPFAETASRRVLTAMLCVVVGSLCLPENTNKPTHRSTANEDKQLPRINQDYLGPLEMCECLTLCCREAQTDPLLLEVTLRGMYYLTLGHEANQQRLGTPECNQLVVRMLKEHSDKPKIVYYCCLCISSLAQNNRANSVLLGQERVCDAVVAALSRYVANEDVAEACCHAIFGLKALNQMLGKAGACEFVLQTLTQHPANATVAQWVCRAIGTLAEYEENKVELDKHNVCKIVTQALQKHVSSDSLLSAALFVRDTSSAGVAQWGCTAIYYIAKGYNSEEYQAKLVAAGACEAVARALVKYSEVETVSYCCCRTLVVLLMNNEPYKAKLGAMGVCACIVESMHLYPSSVQIAKWGCRAVAVLAESNEANVARLGMAGGCETIPVIIQAHQNSEHVAGAGCDVIAFMAENNNAANSAGSGSGSGFAARLGHAGGCEAVISVLRKHNSNPSVVSRAAIALASLARDKGNSAWLGPAGASDALYTALQFHEEDPSVCKFVLSAIGNLCVIENNKERLGAIGTCELVVRVFNRHILDLDTVKAAGLAVGKLCEIITRQQQEGGPEREEGVSGKAVIITPLSPPTNNSGHSDSQSTSGESTIAYTKTRRESVALSAATAFAHLAVDTVSAIKTAIDGSVMTPPSTPISAFAHHKTRPNRAALYASNVCEVLVTALNHHLTNVAVATILSRAISIVAYGHACANERIAFGDLGACKAVTNALQFHEGVEEVAKCGCLAVKALAYHNLQNKVALHTCGINIIVIQILRGYRYASSGPAVVEAAAWAISSLAMDCPLNKMALGSAGACEGLLEVLELHSRNVETAYLTLKALFHVCDGNSANRLKISFSGAADILLSVLTRYPDDDRVVEYVFSTMVGMCLNKVGQSRLGTVGMHKTAVSTLYRYEKTNEYIVLLCCSLVAALSANNKDNQAKLGSAGACKAIVVVMTKYMHSTSGQVGISAVSTPVFGREDKEGVLAAPSVGTASTSSMEEDYARTALSSLVDEFSVLKEGCKAIVHLSSNNEPNRLKLIATGVVDILTAILSSSFVHNVHSVSQALSSSGNTTAAGTIQVSDDTKEWAKQAMDSLIGKTYA